MGIEKIKKETAFTEGGVGMIRQMNLADVAEKVDEIVEYLNAQSKSAEEDLPLSKRDLRFNVEALLEGVTRMLANGDCFYHEETQERLQAKLDELKNYSAQLYRVNEKG